MPSERLETIRNLCGMRIHVSCLKVCNFNQERASARILCTPGICFVLKRIFFSKHTSTSLHTKTSSSYPGMTAY